jgi:2-amino-4-hydroxy-6-hydroxymethyldihydropteridine diphosphokinase
VSQFIVALGSNQGDREATLHAAVGAIAEIPGTSVNRVSGFIDNTAITKEGPSDERPRYLNAVLIGETELSPPELMGALHEIENRHGRIRQESWGDRTLDLDLISMGSEQRETDPILPHPRAHERDFVLAPWLEVDPNAFLIGKGPVSELLKLVTA